MHDGDSVPIQRIVELRVHGIAGTTPQSLVSSVAAVDVAGDGVGRIVRPAGPLLRPVLGVPLLTGDYKLTRIVEGYHWSAMTSGTAGKAAWALLFPFAVANVAHWMLPPLPSTSRVGRLAGHGLHALLRLAALALTALLLAQLAVVSEDLLAAQCLAPGSGCLTVVPSWARLPWVRVLAGLGPPLVVCWILYAVSRVTWKVRGAAGDSQRRPRQEGMLPGDAVTGDPDTPTLRTVHLMAALGTVILLATGGPAGPTPETLRPWWWAGISLLGVAAVLVLVQNDHPGRQWGVALPAWARGGVLSLGVAALLGTGVSITLRGGWPRAPLPGSGPTVEWLALLLTVLTTLTGLLLVPVALFARSRPDTGPSGPAEPDGLDDARPRDGLPRAWRPWAGGWFAAPVLALAGLLGGGFGAGVGLATRRALRDPRLEVALQLPPGYRAITLLWGVAAVLAVVGVLLLAGYLVLLRTVAGTLGPQRVFPLLRLLHPEPRRALDIMGAWWWARWVRTHTHQLLMLLSGVLSVSALAALASGTFSAGVPDWADALAGTGVVVLAGLAAALLYAVYRAATDSETGKALGVLTDLVSFWPRQAHPVVPPCYALKVVPELAERARTYLADPATVVVLTGHSQGSLLAAVAAARLQADLDESTSARLGLVVAGSQLQWAYARGFPGVVSFGSMGRLHEALSRRGDRRWHALCRGTDPLGGDVLSWNRRTRAHMLHGNGFRPQTAPGPVGPAVRSGTGALLLGGDRWLPDPRSAPRPGGARRWRPGISGHFDFYADPEWDLAIAAAAGLVAPQRPLPPSASEDALWRVEPFGLSLLPEEPLPDEQLP